MYIKNIKLLKLERKYLTCSLPAAGNIYLSDAGKMVRRTINCFKEMFENPEVLYSDIYAHPRWNVLRRTFSSRSWYPQKQFSIFVFLHYGISAFPHFRITAWKNYRFMGSLIKTLSTSHNQKANRGRESVCKYEQSTLNSPFRGLTESSLPILKDEHSKQPKRQFSLSHLKNIFSGFLVQFCI